MERQTHTRRGVLCALLGGACWGFSGTCGQYLFAEKSMDPGWLTAARMLIAGALLLLVCLPRQKAALVGIFKSRRDALQLILFGVCGLLVSQITYLKAISYTNSGTATVLQYLGQPLLLLLVCAAARRLPTLREGAGVVLAVCGTYILATHLRGTLAISLPGLLWGLAAALGLVLYTMLPVRLISKWGNQVVIGYGMIIGGAFVLLVTRAWTIPVRLDLATVAAVLAVGVVGTALAYSLYLQGVVELGPAKASMLACAEPVSATVCSALWLKTRFTAPDLVGFACVVGMVLLLTTPGRRNRGEPGARTPEESLCAPDGLKK